MMENANTQPEDKRNLYQIVIDNIMEKINANSFSFEKPLCTEKQLMEEYGISRITAKRAIEELEHKGILYRKRGVGSFVSRDIFSKPTSETAEDTKIFAFILPFDISKGGILETVQSVSTALSAAGHYTCIYITDRNNAKEKSVLRQLLNQNIAGIVFYPMTNDYHLELLNSFVIKDKPIVILDKSNSCQYISGVVSDNFQGGIILTDYLISLGHRNIAYLSRFGTAELTSIRDRFGGYICALKKAGISPRSEYIVTDLTSLRRSETAPDQNVPTLNEVVKRFYDAGVTAIEAECDEVAFSILLACKELNIKVPEEMSVCGFDNSEWAHMSESGITTVRQNFTEIGKKVSEIFLDNLAKTNTQAQKITVPVELLVQGSSGPVNA